MVCFERFCDRMKQCGNSLKMAQLKNGRELLNTVFDDDVSSRDDVYFWRLNDVDYENKDNIPIRLYKRSYSAAKGGSVNFTTMYQQPVIVGDVLYEKNADQYWLCSESYNVDDMYWKGKLTQCNWILKWQNKNGDLLEYPCYAFNATQYNSGETTTRLSNFTIGTSQYMIHLPCDENTLLIDTPQRFFLDYNKNKTTTYIVTQNDTTSLHIGKKGIVRLTVYETPNDTKTDNLELGVCDYIEKINTEDNDNPIGEIYAQISYDSQVILSGGDSQTFEGSFYYTNDNTVVQDIEGSWNVVSDFNDKINIQKVGNKITISVDNDDLIDEDFRIIYSNQDKSCSTSLIVSIRSLL